MLRASVLAAVFSLLPATGTLAQEPATRAEADRQRREEKSRSARPYEPGGLERAVKFAETRGIFILDREGFYPKLGSLTTGSGFAYGLGFRDRDLFGNTATLDFWAAASIKRYWAAEARVTLPRLAHNHLWLEMWAGRRDYPQENYFGVGPASRRSDRSDYAIRTDGFGGRAAVKPVRIAAVGAALERLEPRLSRGKNGRVPDIDAVFSPSSVPGLLQSSDFLRSSVFMEVDYRQPRNARKGGWYRFEFSHYDDRTGGAFTFDRTDVDLRQFVSFLGERRGLAGRLFVSTSGANGSGVPFYFMPTLGGNDTLRGFREYRFRAPHAILVQGEYRWEIWSGFDGALFYDAGKVADRRADLDFEDLERDYGIGFRFNTDEGVVFRIDAAFGSRDGRHLYLVFGGVF